MTTTPILYSFRRCPYAMRARIGLVEAGIKVELREIILRDKPAHMLEISPKATVPVLLLPEGKVIDESLDIMLWALLQNDPNNLLKPDDSIMQRLINQTNNNRESHFKSHLDRYKYSSRYDDDQSQAVGLEARDQALIYIQKLNVLLSDSKFLLGNTPCVADYAIAPFIRQYANTNRDWWDQLPYPNIKNWLTNFIESKLFQTTFTKFPTWQTSDEPTYFP